MLTLMHSSAVFSSDWLDALFPDTSSQVSTPFVWNFPKPKTECDKIAPRDRNDDGEVDAYEEYWEEEDREYIRMQTQDNLVVTICDYDFDGFLYCYDL